MSLTLVVMGVSGAGKSTLAEALARHLGWPLAEGDAFHPPENLARMRAGLPLDDAARAPWLAALAQWIGAQEAAGVSAVMACSALKRRHRDALSEGHPSVRFLFLDVPREELARRLAHRKGHFMPASLLDSQLQTLEPPAPDEPAVRFEGTPTVQQVTQRLRL